MADQGNGKGSQQEILNAINTLLFNLYESMEQGETIHWVYKPRPKILTKDPPKVGMLFIHKPTVFKQIPCIERELPNADNLRERGN